jgi:hypothetical protein
MDGFAKRPLLQAVTLIPPPIRVTMSFITPSARTRRENDSIRQFTLSFNSARITPSDGGGVQLQHRYNIPVEPIAPRPADRARSLSISSYRRCISVMNRIVPGQTRLGSNLGHPPKCRTSFAWSSAIFIGTKQLCWLIKAVCPSKKILLSVRLRNGCTRRERDDDAQHDGGGHRRNPKQGSCGPRERGQDRQGEKPEDDLCVWLKRMKESAHTTPTKAHRLQSIVLDVAVIRSEQHPVSPGIRCPPSAFAGWIAMMLLGAVAAIGSR